MLAHTAASVWQTIGFKQLLVRCWDEDYFVFNPASGHTHVLNQAAFAILSFLAEHPASLSRLTAECFEQDTPESRQILIDQLAQMRTMGLVEKR